VAVAGNMDIPKTYSEKDWSDLSKISAYPKSKTLAEKADKDETLLIREKKQTSLALNYKSWTNICFF